MFQRRRRRAAFAAPARKFILAFGALALTVTCKGDAVATPSSQVDPEAQRREAREILAELRRRTRDGGASGMPAFGPAGSSKGLLTPSVPRELPGSSPGRFDGVETPELWRRFKQKVEPFRINERDGRWPLPEVAPAPGAPPSSPDLKPPSRLVEQLASGPSVLRNARGVAAVFSASCVRKLGDGRVEVKTPSAREARSLCADERFAELPAGAECTAFLVSPRTVATAAHCVDPRGTNGARAKDLRFVFGYQAPRATVGTWIVPASNVYHGAKLSSWKPSPRPQDPYPEWAIVELDRPVEDRAHLTLAVGRKLRPEAPVYVLGHPLGLPLIFDGGAKRVIRVSNDGTFDTNLDTYQGNSGSPVFSEKTHEVVGMLVWGEQDFETVRVGDCQHSIACLVAGCGREVCTDVSQFASKAQ
jgi:V8-like Glu-specific endopeptidase